MPRIRSSPDLYRERTSVKLTVVESTCPPTRAATSGANPS